jgi:hypothetical protein
MSSDRQELIRRFAVAIAGARFVNPNDVYPADEHDIWYEAAMLADAEPPQPPADNRIESTQTVSPNAATRLTPDEFYAAVIAYMPWIAERIPQHQRVIQAVRLCAKSPEQAACAIEVAWMDGGVEPQPPVDDRIGRALELMLEAFRQRADTHGRCEGWEMVSEAVQILEGRANEQ